jgi:hypothetical protein
MKKLTLVLAFLFSVAKPVWAADFTCAAGNVICLITAIQVANQNGEDNDIILEQGTYTLTAVDNSANGPNGLPSITGRMRIHGPDGSQPYSRWN